MRPAAARPTTGTLPPLVKVVVPTPSLARDDPALARFADGFAADLVELLRRLGGVWAVPWYQGPGPRGEAAKGPARSPPDPAAEDSDSLLVDFTAQAVACFRLDVDADGGEVGAEVELLRRGGSVAWRDRVRFVDGHVREARLALAGDLVAVLTGMPTDARAVRDLGTSSLAAWREACEARHAHDALADRRDRARLATTLDPAFADAWLLLADLEAAAARPDKAPPTGLREDLPRRIPGIGRAWLARAKERASSGLRPGAAADLREALRLPLDGPALLDAVRLADELADPGLADGLLERASSARLMDPSLFDRLAGLRFKQRRTAEAIALWERAYLLSRTPRGLRARLALAHLRLGHDERAAELFDEAAARDPVAVETWHHYALFHQEKGHLKEALAMLDRAVTMDPRAAGPRVSRAAILEDLGRREEARADLHAALASDTRAAEELDARARLRRIDLDPEGADRVARLFATAAAAIRQGLHAEALSPLAAVLKAAPDWWQAWFFLGTAHRLAARWVPAEGAFRRVLDIRPDQPDAWNELGIALLGQERGADALAATSRAHDLRPGDPAILCNLGVSRLEVGDLAGARDALEHAVVIAPSDATLARCFSELERREAASGLDPRERPRRGGPSPSQRSARAGPLPFVRVRPPDSPPRTGGVPAPGPEGDAQDLDSEAVEWLEPDQEVMEFLIGGPDSNEWPAVPASGAGTPVAPVPDATSPAGGRRSPDRDGAAPPTAPRRRGSGGSE